MELSKAAGRRLGCTSENNTKANYSVTQKSDQYVTFRNADVRAATRQAAP